MAKSIADKIDWGAILLGVTPKDLESLNTILSANSFDQPIIKLSIYKNRRGKYKGIYLWCKANLGCCRVEPMFATTYGYDLIQMDDIEIKITPEEAF